MQRIALFNPPIQDFYQTTVRQEPLGLAYLAATLQEQGYIVNLIDALGKSFRKTIPIPSQFAYMRDFYPHNDCSPFKLFQQYQHFGLSFEQIVEETKNFKPDIIGISMNFTPYAITALELAKKCKAIFELSR